MAGCFTDIDITPNRIEQARIRCAATTGYYDLTSSNPTHHGLLFPPDILRQAADAYWYTRRYTPHPHGMLAAREAIVAYYAQRTPPLALTSDNIFITASSSEAYSLLFALLCSPGDTILVPDVGYPLIEYIAALHHISVRSYHLNEQRGWQIDEASLIAQADEHTRAIVIVSPHNPTGAVVSLPLPALEQLAIPIVCDEVFAAFPYGVPHVPPLATLHPTLPIFHVNGISKLLALPDLKLGWVACNAPAHALYAERFALINDTMLSANGLTQAMLPTLLAQSHHFIHTMRERIERNLHETLASCATCSALHMPPPDGGYYLFAALPGWHEDEEELILWLLEQGVLVHPGFFFGECKHTHILFSVLAEPQYLARGIERLLAAVRKMAQS